MTQHIVLEGDIAKLIDTRIVAQAPLSSLAPFLETRLPTVLPMLPDHTRVVAFNPTTNRGVFIIEQRPFRTNITLHVAKNDINLVPADKARVDGQQRAVFNLLFPYQYYAYGFTLRVGDEDELTDFTLELVYLYWSPKPLTTLADGLWLSQLPNVDRDARICWGDTTAPTNSIAERIDGQVKNFAATIFNSHLHLPSGGYNGFTEWETASADPLAYLHMPIFTADPDTTPNYIIERLIHTDTIPVADMTLNENWIPAPPPLFTIGRAMEWMAALPAQQRHIFLTALQQTINEEPPNG